MLYESTDHNKAEYDSWRKRKTCYSTNREGGYIYFRGVMSNYDYTKPNGAFRKLLMNGDIFMRQETIDRIRKFTVDREWEQYHTPANLAKSISIEAAELLECFQWSDTDYDLEHVKEELADVMVYCRNLLDTLAANRDRCVGMAANMIGVRKRIIIVNIGFMNLVMYNPVLLKKDTPYETEEGCLSLEGVRKTTRYQNIEVEYLDSSWKKQRQKFSGWTAQIVLHEFDHLEGVII